MLGLVLKPNLLILTDACENAATDYGSKTDSKKVLVAPCPANKDVGNCNSFATAPICKKIEKPNLRVHNMVYKSPGDILPLSKAPERRQTRKIRKSKSLILTDTSEKKDLRKKPKKKREKLKKAEGFPKKY